MSVVKGYREVGNFRVFNEVMTLCKYTLRAVKSEKVFPKSYRWLLSQKIADEAVDAVACVKRANSVHVITQKDFDYRRDQQLRAYAHLEALLGLIDVAFNVLEINAHKIEFWTGLVITTENSLKNWSKSDKQRYPQFAPKTKN
jgi:hypothetical protein